MAPRKETTEIQRSNVLVLRAEGKSIREIATKLGINSTTVWNIIKRYNATGSLKNKDGRGCNKILTPGDETYLSRIVRQEPFVSGPKLAKMMEKATGKPISRTTISRTLKKYGIRSRIPRKKPFISAKNQLKRLRYAKKYAKMPISFWKKVVWTDESKFNIHGSDGRKRVWRLDGEALNKKYMQGTVKHGGGSVMVWGAMCYGGAGSMEFIDGIMKSEDYRLILERNISKTTKKFRMGRNFVFMHDNDPKHKSNLVTEYLKNRDIEVLDHPPQSPDLNVIEHLWDEIGRELLERPIRNKEQLKSAITSIWDTVLPETTKKLVESMPQRLAEVIKNKGGHTSY